MRKYIELGLLMLIGPLSAAAERPNIVLIMTDDQGYPDLSIHGNKEFATPEMDRLAREGIQFSDFHVNPFCSPTRAALMTGLMSDKVGVPATNWQRNLLMLDAKTMPQYFRAAGYSTGLFGKWHLGGNYPYRPIDRGFDQWVGLGANGLSTTSDFWNNDRMDDLLWRNGKMEKSMGFGTDVFFNEAIRFIKEKVNDKKPFFSYIATNVPHWDWNVPGEWTKEFEGKMSPLRAGFYASIKRVDWNIGRLRKVIEDLGVEDDTIFIFLTDNGSDVPFKRTAYTAGMRGFKGSLYEGGHRVPFFIKGPRKWVGKPKVVSKLSAHVDLLPTLIDICGLDISQLEQNKLDGRSLVPLLKESGEIAPLTLIMHHQNTVEQIKYKKGVLLTEKWRFIIKSKGKYELYKIQEDRAQQTNLASLYPDVVARFEGIYSKHWDRLPYSGPFERVWASSKAELRLTTDQSLHSGPISQHAIRNGDKYRGSWIVKVKEAGTYAFELRRWPKEANTAIRAGLTAADDPKIEYIGHANWNIAVPGVAMDYTQAELKINGKSQGVKDVQDVDKAVVYHVNLEPSDVAIDASFIKRDGSQNGVYYVNVRKVE